MTQLSIPRPAADEAAPFYHGCIAKVPGENIGEQLVDQLAELERLFGALDDTAALARYAPGKWSVKEVLGHLTDAERIFSYRLLRIGRGDATPLPGFDENSYVPAGGGQRQDDHQPRSRLHPGGPCRAPPRSSARALRTRRPPGYCHLVGEPMTFPSRACGTAGPRLRAFVVKNCAGVWLPRLRLRQHAR